MRFFGEDRFNCIAAIIGTLLILVGVSIFIFAVVEEVTMPFEEVTNQMLPVQNISKQVPLSRIKKLFP